MLKSTITTLLEVAGHPANPFLGVFNVAEARVDFHQ